MTCGGIIKKNFQILEKKVSFYFITFNFFCYYCSINLKGSRNIQGFALIRAVLSISQIFTFLYVVLVFWIFWWTTKAIELNFERIKFSHQVIAFMFIFKSKRFHICKEIYVKIVSLQKILWADNLKIFWTFSDRILILLTWYAWVFPSFCLKYGLQLQWRFLKKKLDLVNDSINGSLIK